MSSTEAFHQLIQSLTREIGARPLDASLQADLQRQFPYDGKVCQDIVQACKKGIEEGWMCKHEHGGIRYGRVIKPCPELNGYSVDVVEMNDIAGPEHRHPLGEIDLIMPLDGPALFDGAPAGWLVYGPDTVHRPTVSQGRALVLYLLPEGQIEFTRPAGS
ncbi:MAG: DUF4863 family protein [Burkholderiaceae bacterium]